MSPWCIYMVAPTSSKVSFFDEKALSFFSSSSQIGTRACGSALRNFASNRRSRTSSGPEYLINQHHYQKKEQLIFHRNRRQVFGKY